LDSKEFKGEYHHKFNKQANQHNFTHAGLFYKNLLVAKKNQAYTDYFKKFKFLVIFKAVENLGCYMKLARSSTPGLAFSMESK
jgi:hypothetical protein